MNLNKTYLVVICCIFVVHGSLARSVYYSDIDNSLDRADDGAGLPPLGRPLPDGYYVVDKGRLQVVPSANRRQELPQGTRFTPIVKYKQSHAKRKRLFVPNFFG